MKVGRISLIGLILPMAVFAQNPEFLVNPQGLAQQDLSIRGSSYSGTGISLNGLNLKVPYSAHFNAELPIPDYLLADPIARHGQDNASGFLIGTENDQFVPQAARLQTTIGIGSRENYTAGVSAFEDGIGGFVEGEKALRIDHNANDLNRYSGGVYAQQFVNDWQLDLLAGYQQKDFGAQGYYGVPSNIYAEDHTRDALVFLGAMHGDLDGSFLRAGTAFRAFDDEYRIPSATFGSDVHSYLGSAFVEGRTLEIQDIALNLRSDLEHERISGDLGDHQRTRGSILIFPEMRLERFTIKAGLNGVFQTAESAEWLPQAGIDFFATDNTKLYASYSENVQQPDYQVLYYTAPYHINNIALDLQHSQNHELGLHQFVSAKLDWRVAVFHRRLENASDWVKATVADTAWTATDLGSMDVSGIDAAVNYVASDDLQLQLYYQGITKDDYPFYSGLYELDYPEQLLALSGHWRISPELQVFGTQTLRYQTDNKARAGNDLGSAASLGLHYDPRFANNVRLSFLVENLWGSDFQAIPGLKPRPLSVSTGITVTW